MIVIGGSLGGMKALRKILAGLPESFPEAIAVVLHRQKDTDESLAEVLNVGGTLRVEEVLDKEPLRPGHVWLAPANYHLLVEEEHLSLSTDDPVNFARPSIDVLFESAADAFGEEVIAVVLSGANQDGAQGALSVQLRGGTVLIQDPATAECGIMPSAALQATQSPHVLALDAIAARLIDAAAQRGRTQP